jgi:hypothetical protein
VSGRNADDIGEHHDASALRRMRPRLSDLARLAACLAVPPGGTGDFYRSWPISFGDGSATGRPDRLLMPRMSAFAFIDDVQRMRELAATWDRWRSVVSVDFSFAPVAGTTAPPSCGQVRASFESAR